MFYFPGCGSERLFSQVGLATQAMLYEVGAQTVLPPGLPAAAATRRPPAGEADKGKQIVTEQPGAVPPRGQHAQLSGHQDRHRVLRHLHGPAAEIPIRQDLPRLPPARHPRVPAWRKASSSRAWRACSYLYHDPCHTPMKTNAPLKVATSLMGSDVNLSDRCCGESGTLRRHPPRHLHPGALPQGRGDARRACAQLTGTRRAVDGEREVAHLLPVLPAGAGALQRRHRH